MDNNIGKFSANYIKINTNPSKQAEIVKESNNNLLQNQNFNNFKSTENTYVFSNNLFLNTQIVKMSNEMVLRYLQSLLEMPETIEKFIEQMSENKANSNIFGENTRVIIDGMLDVAQLAKYLNENSKAALQKLLAVISYNLKTPTADNSQLKEILNALVNISQNLNTSNNYNAIKEFLLLYLPIELQNFERSQNNPVLGEDSEEVRKNSNFLILFETINFSSFTVSIQEIDSVIYINPAFDKTFPFEKFKSIIDKAAKNLRIRTTIELKIKRENEEKTNFKTGNFKIISSGKVPVNVVLTAHLLIETIFKIDKDFIAAT